MESIPGVAGAGLVRLKAHRDDRGALTEAWRSDGMPIRPVQCNVSVSQPRVLRGLHHHRRQTDYWYIADSSVFVALADLRTHGIWTATFTPDDRVGLLVPPGVAHGFYAVGRVVLIYLVDQLYDGSDEHGIAWDDPTLAIPWPDRAPVLSERDRSNPRLAAATS